MKTLLPPGVAVAQADPLAPADGLWDLEAHDIRQAIPERRRAFAAGRRAARAAMAELGLPAVALPVTEGRAPGWPEGYCGSITHDDRACLAVVCRSGSIRGIGIDIEPATPLPDDLWPVVCQQEMTWLCRLPHDEAGIMARAVFCAKESFFKAQFPLTSRWLDFDAVRVSVVDGDMKVATAVPISPWPVGTLVRCRFRIDQDHIMTALTLG